MPAVPRRIRRKGSVAGLQVSEEGAKGRIGAVCDLGRVREGRHLTYRQADRLFRSWEKSGYRDKAALSWYLEAQRLYELWVGQERKLAQEQGVHDPFSAPGARQPRPR